MVRRSLEFLWSRINPTVKFIFLAALFGMFGIALKLEGIWVASSTVFVIYLIVFVTWLNDAL